MSMGIALLVAVTILPAYILGSINGAIITSKVLYRKDIRDYGSGNAGLTNFYRVFGLGGALLVLLIDVLKTVAPLIFGGWLFSNYLDTAQAAVFPNGWIVSATFFGQALAGLAVVVGHCFPLFYKLKGGKGVMALGCIVIVLDWRLALIAWGVFIILTIATRYVSLGSVIGSLSIPAIMLFFRFAGVEIAGMAELSIVTMTILLIVVRHAGNIKRIIRGEESKISFIRKKAEGE